MINSLEKKKKKREMLLKNSKSLNNITEKEIDEKSKKIGFEVMKFENKNGNCGDILKILIIFENNVLKKMLFSAQPDHACIIISSLTNIFSEYLIGKNKNDVKFIVDNFHSMIKNKKYNLENYPNLNLFEDIKNFPSRLECANLVVKAIYYFL